MTTRAVRQVDLSPYGKHGPIPDGTYLTVSELFDYSIYYGRGPYQ